VPTFIFDGQYTLSGAQEPGSMARILDQVAEFAAGRETTP
jgi:predicted DsbA family dithiol-disulfide isomerase